MAWYNRGLRRAAAKLIFGDRQPRPSAAAPDVNLRIERTDWTMHGPTSVDADPRDIGIVTAFVDIGRGAWKSDVFVRSSEVYFRRFSSLAKLKNPMVIYCEDASVDRILQIRSDAGNEALTTVMSVPSFFDLNEPKRLLAEQTKRMTPQLRTWVDRPGSPEYNKPHYNVIMAFKAAWCVSAINLAIVNSRHIAWIDFGYCRDDHRFDTSRPWRYDFGRKFTLFNIAPLQKQGRDLSSIVKTGEVIFQGCHLVGTREEWLRFLPEVEAATNELLRLNLVDDDQTLFYMVWHKSPELYSTIAIDPRDWFVAMRNFAAD